jgi:hypothetical protein
MFRIMPRVLNGERVAMPFKVQIGPPQISIHQGQTVLISEPDGQINWPSERGLYFLDTRVVSSWAVYANGEPWELLNGGAITYYAARIFLTNRSFATENGAIPPRTLGFTISRWIGGGMHEDLDITNNGMKPVKFQLEIAIRCDFADLFEVKSGNIVRRGRITTEWSEARQQLRTIYRNDDFSRSVTISAQRFPTEAVYANGRLSFKVALDPGEAWHSIPCRITTSIRLRHITAWRIGCGPWQKFRPAMRSSIAFFAAHLRTWPRSASQSRARIILSSCLPPGFPGSSRHSDATA